MRSIYIICVFVFMQSMTFAQSPNGGSVLTDPATYIPKIYPSAPETFKFSNYGNTPVGLFTGAPNITIPLMTYTNSDISIPLSLSYSSNGIHVDDTNGSVGLGWSFISGGVINETVRGLPDRSKSSTEPRPNIDSLGLWTPKVVEYLNDIQLGGIDGEPDLYTANFCGNSMKFVFDENDRPIIFSQKDFHIKRQQDSFIITKEDGTEYYFETKEKVTNRNIAAGSGGEMRESYAWYLTKIKSGIGHEVYIEYFNRSYSTIVSQSQTLAFTPAGIIQYQYDDNGFGQCIQKLFILSAQNGMSSILSTNQHVQGKQIKRIYNNVDSNEINFSYNEIVDNDVSSIKAIKQSVEGQLVKDLRFEYDSTQNGRIFLKSIINALDSSSYKFDYINKENVPERLSLSRDIWGLYNEKQNMVLVPQIFHHNDINSVIYEGANQEFNDKTGLYGLLNKIQYPTGGNSEIFYEPHKKNDIEIIPGPRGNVFLNASADFNKPSTTETVTIISKKDEFLKFNAYASYNLGGSCNDPGSHLAQAFLTISKSDGQKLDIFVYSPTMNTYMYAPSMTDKTVRLFEESEFTEFYVYLKKDEQVTFTLTALRCSASTVTFDYATGYDTEYETLKPFGGFRVFKTIDEPLGSEPIIRHYQYMDGDNSSVRLTRMPYFLQNQTTRSYCNNFYGTWVDLNFISLTSSNVNQLVSSNPNIFYSVVTEKIEGKGEIVHHYNINTDYWGKTLIGQDIATAPWTNFGWDNGNEIKTEYFAENGKLLKSISYNYVQDEDRNKYIDGIVFRKNFILKVLRDVVMKCTYENINKSHTQYYCLAQHSHVWYTWSETCHGTGHIDSWVTFRSYCYGHQVGDQVIVPNVFENFDFVQYKNISHFSYLQSQKTTDYFDGLKTEEEIRYFYGNKRHTQPTIIKTTFPDLSIQETAYQYAHEKNNQYLINKNMIGIPLETIVTKKLDSMAINGKVISRLQTLFPISQSEANAKTSGLALPFEKLSKNLETGVMEQQISYDKYDNRGNLLQYTLKPDANGVGISTVIIWGYNQTQPIAKIEGARLSEIDTGMITTIVNASDYGTNYSEADLIMALDTFRAGLPGYQVTTYTYKPLVGVTTITPPSGIREYYHYDSANRLERVEDVNHNILKKYEYHYKTP